MSTPKSYSILELMKGAGLSYEGPEKQITGLASYLHACQTEVCFFELPADKSLLKTIKAGACFIQENDMDYLPKETLALITLTPKLSFLKASRLFTLKIRDPFIDPTAKISAQAFVHASASVGAFVVIEDGVHIGAECVIGAGSVIKEKVVMGAGCHIAEQVTLSHAFLKDGVSIGSGSRIGEKGFGFVRDEQGFIDVPHLGCVYIGHHVDIGSNCIVDRGTFSDTHLEDHVRIGSLSYVSHNVTVKKGAIIVGQSAIGGSSVIGEYCILGAQVGIREHIVLGIGTSVTAQSGVMRSSKAGEKLGGSPARPVRQWHTEQIVLKNLAMNRKNKIDKNEKNRNETDLTSK